MDEPDYNEITRVVLTRLSDQLRRVAEDLGQKTVSQSDTLPAPKEARPVDERRARFRNELVAKLGGRRG